MVVDWEFRDCVVPGAWETGETMEIEAIDSLAEEEEKWRLLSVSWHLQTRNIWTHTKMRTAGKDGAVNANLVGMSSIMEVLCRQDLGRKVLGY